MTADTSVGDVLGSIVTVALLAAVLWWLATRVQRFARGLRDRKHERPAAESPAAVERPAESTVIGGRDISAEDRGVIRGEARQLEQHFEYGVDGRAVLLEDPVFQQSLERVRGLRLSTETLVSLAAGHDAWVSRLVLPLLADRADVPERWLSIAIRRLPPAPWDLAGLYLLSLERAPGEVIGNTLAKLEDVRPEDFIALLNARISTGRETVDADLMRRHVPLSMAEQVQMLLDTFELPAGVEEAFRRWLESGLDFGEVGRYVKLWSRPFEEDDSPALVESRRAEVADELIAALEDQPPRSVILVGEHGVGKTALARAALDRLPEGWVVFEAGAAQMNADAMYVGQLEGRIESLVDRLRGRQTVWVFPAFEEALYAGTYSSHPTGLLDALLPHIETGAIRLVAEITPANYELLVAKRPRMQSAFRALRLRPLTEVETVRVLDHALESSGAHLEAEEAVLVETYELAQQFLPGVAQPGGALRLLEATIDDAVEREAHVIEASDVLAALATLSGLPLTLLDASRPLDLDAVRAFFGERVLGQDEAVRAIVDRIALVKAGLTDPTRPLGVYLFVGPTGTGKTELAKALATFMFGSQNRLVRIDMSELQTPDALERLLADTTVEETGSPLIAAVRKDPFSVVLLDEFEKAAAPIWDVFLQVFDDGRLTDRSGRTTDFRRCIIILTSNVGSALRTRPGIGFSDADHVFDPRDVERALERAFRPEFLNRIDQVLVFRPFGPAEMRELLDKELAEVLQRRGIRGKQWAIEIDESATSFLLDEGFSPALGARPLKRAVEKHLLTPLARAMVDAETPEGEQFLFVTAKRDRIDVDFVGLDDDELDDGSTAPEREGVDALESEDLRVLLRSGHFSPSAQRKLLADLHEIEGRLDNELVERKAQALEEVSGLDFWERPDRFRVLAQAEYLDRFEAACRTASKLGGRLARQLERGGSRATSDGSDTAELCRLLASRIYTLDSALHGIDESAPFEAFLRLRIVGAPKRDATEESAFLDAFLDALLDMYLSWADRRGMHAEVLERSDEEAILAVGGLGSWMILAPEAGLHVLEVLEPGEQDGRSVERVSVSVQLAERPPGERSGADALARQARAVLAATELPAQIVRRYRSAPSALVRDAVRGYRTGRLESVLAGDFDLFVGGA